MLWFSFFYACSRPRWLGINYYYIVCLGFICILNSCVDILLLFIWAILILLALCGCLCCCWRGALTVLLRCSACDALTIFIVLLVRFIFLLFHVLRIRFGCLGLIGSSSWWWAGRLILSRRLLLSIWGACLVWSRRRFVVSRWCWRSRCRTCICLWIAGRRWTWWFLSFRRSSSSGFYYIAISILCWSRRWVITTYYNGRSFRRRWRGSIVFFRRRTILWVTCTSIRCILFTGAGCSCRIIGRCRYLSIFLFCLRGIVNFLSVIWWLWRATGLFIFISWNIWRWLVLCFVFLFFFFFSLCGGCFFFFLFSGDLLFLFCFCGSRICLRFLLGYLFLLQSCCCCCFFSFSLLLHRLSSCIGWRLFASARNYCCIVCELLNNCWNSDCSRSQRPGFKTEPNFHFFLKFLYLVDSIWARFLNCRCIVVYPRKWNLDDRPLLDVIEFFNVDFQIVVVSSVAFDISRVFDIVFAIRELSKLELVPNLRASGCSVQAGNVQHRVFSVGTFAIVNWACELLQLLVTNLSRAICHLLA